jgi:hypothetical protein
METTETTGAVSSHGVKKRVKRVDRRESKWGTPFAREKQSGLERGPNKRLANLWSRKKITKKAQAGRGHETEWEIATNEPDCNYEKSAAAKQD